MKTPKVVKVTVKAVTVTVRCSEFNFSGPFYNFQINSKSIPKPFACEHITHSNAMMNTLEQHPQPAAAPADASRMELDAYSTLEDSVIRHVINAYFSIRDMNPYARKQSMKKMMASLKLSRSSVLGRDIRRCFQSSKTCEFSEEERLALFVSTISFALKDSISA